MSQSYLFDNSTSDRHWPEQSSIYSRVNMNMIKKLFESI